MVVLDKLRAFQDAGHLVVLIIGDYTARVGDPSGRVGGAPGARRTSRSTPTPQTFQEQAFKVLDRERTEVRRNSEWLAMASDELFGWCGGSRWRACWSGRSSAGGCRPAEPISVLELLYPMLQGYDSVAVEADVELGGTDQKFNLLFGRDVQGAFGAAGAVDPDDADPARDRRGAADEQVAGQLRRRHRCRPRRCSGS